MRNETVAVERRLFSEARETGCVLLAEVAKPNPGFLRKPETEPGLFAEAGNRSGVFERNALTDILRKTLRNDKISYFEDVGQATPKALKHDVLAISTGRERLETFPCMTCAHSWYATVRTHMFKANTPGIV